MAVFSMLVYNMDTDLRRQTGRHRIINLKDPENPSIVNGSKTKLDLNPGRVQLMKTIH